MNEQGFDYRILYIDPCLVQAALARRQAASVRAESRHQNSGQAPASRTGGPPPHRQSLPLGGN